jgi:hypothetical protein
MMAREELDHIDWALDRGLLGWPVGEMADEIDDLREALAAARVGRHERAAPLIEAIGKMAGLYADACSQRGGPGDIIIRGRRFSRHGWASRACPRRYRALMRLVYALSRV